VDILKMFIIGMWIAVLLIGGIFIFVMQENQNGALDSQKGIGTQKESGTEDILTLKSPYTLDEKELAIKIHEKVNEQREIAGVGQLEFDYEIEPISIMHSKDMEDRNFFDHVNPSGEDPNDRAEKFDFECRKEFDGKYTEGIAENLFKGYAFYSSRYIGGVEVSREWLNEDEISENTVQGWMNSPAHKENMLRGIFDREAIGVVVAQNYTIFVTQNLC